LEYWSNQIETNEIHEKFEEVRIEQHKIGYKTFSWFKIFFEHYLHGSDSSMLSSMPSRAIINPGNIVEFLNATSNLFNLASYQYMPILNKQLLLATGLIGQIEKDYPLRN
jgi:hypothetical protein